MHQLTEAVVGDQPAAWSDAGFTIDGEAVALDGVRLILAGPAAGRGLVSIAVDGLLGDLDGVVVHRSVALEPAATPAHPNGIDAIDHLVMTTPDCDRTTDALVAAGLEVRRARRLGDGAEARRQTFFWLARVILELVGPDQASGSGPARLWGLALTAADLDATVAQLGSRCSRPRPAVQDGRRIATIRTRELGIGIPLAVMSPHPCS